MVNEKHIRSMTDQNIKISMLGCIQWLFKTSGDNSENYEKYIKGWKAWIEFGLKNPYYGLLTGWVHAEFKPQLFIDVKRFDKLLMEVCNEEIARIAKQKDQE